MEGIQTLMNLSPQFVLKMICKFYPWQEKQLKQYEDLLSWEFISKNENIIWTEADINRYSGRLDFGVWGLPINKSDEDKEDNDIIINVILKVFSDNICHAKNAFHLH